MSLHRDRRSGLSTDVRRFLILARAKSRNDFQVFLSAGQFAVGGLHEVERRVFERRRQHSLVHGINSLFNLTQFFQPLRIIELGCGDGDQLLGRGNVAILDARGLPLSDHRIE